MNKKIVIFFLAMLLGIPALLWAAEEINDSETSVVKDTDALTEVGNTICPVTGEKVGQNGEKIVKQEYKGKVYNLCCSMCVKDFAKDPEKYAKIAEDQAKEVKASEAAESSDKQTAPEKGK